MTEQLSRKEEIIRRNAEEIREEDEPQAKVAPIQPPSILNKNLDKILREQGVAPSEQSKKPSNKAIRSKRYYIRKRFSQGKPYIPARVRALGKEKARELGYRTWEDRVIKREEEEVARHDRLIMKLSIILGLVAKTRLQHYFRERRKDGLL